MERKGFGDRIGSWRRELAARLNRLPTRTRRGLAVAGAAAVVLAGFLYATSGSPPNDGSAPGLDGDGLGAAHPEPRIIVVDPAGDSAGEEGNGEPAAPVVTPPDTLQWPVAGPVIAAHGWGRDATMDDWRFHSGIDLAAPQGEVVVAAADGRVTAVYLDDAWGWVVELEHAPGYVSRYANLARPEVAEGVQVRAGDPVGTVGASASVKAGQQPHLHFELQWGGQPADPLSLLPQGS